MNHPFICFDTEDNSEELLASGGSGFDKKVTQIAAITASGNTYYNKGDVKAFKEWLRTSKERWIYAHNLQYDLGNLFGDKLDELDITMVGGRLIKAVWGNKTFVDSYNIWPMSVKKLAPAFGLKKLETKSMSTDKNYVFNDVKIIHKAMSFAWGFVEKLGLSHLPPTLGGLCIKVWKSLDGVNCHDSHELSREALYGGRVELFHICDEATWGINKPEIVYACFHGDETPQVLQFGQGNVCYTDINSLYPAMMRLKYPGQLTTWESKSLPEYGIVKCMVEQPETDLTILPYRGKDGRILYPWGKMQGTWTIAELREFERLGGKILKVYDVLGTNESCQPYESFVDYLYQARLESRSEAEKLFFKLLMNNLFGRLGTSGVIGRSVWQNDNNKYDGIPYGDKVLVNYHMPLSDETNWSHAAYITAYSRLELYRYLSIIGSKRLIYCDTDSCVFNSLDKSIPFTYGKDLGQMKLVGWYDGAIAFAPKMYKIGDTYKAKGVPEAKAKTFIESGHAEFDLPFKLREAMRFYDRENSKRLSVWRKVHKLRRTEYDKKKLQGNAFSPCKVNDI